MTTLFERDGHRHINGDSTDVNNYMQVMGSDKAKLILADPPFCLLVRRNKKTGQLRDKKEAKINHEAVKRYENVREYRTFTKEWMQPASEFLTDDGSFIVWTNFLGKDPIKQTAEKLGLNYHGEFLWGKLTKETVGSEVNARVYEVALVFGKGERKEATVGEAVIPWSVITRYDEEKEAELWGSHPNHKPFSCIEPLIRTYTKPGDRVLDPFTGSGSTPAAAIKLERLVSGIELRPHWADMSQNRIAKMLEN